MRIVSGTYEETSLFTHEKQMQSGHALPKRNQMAFSAINSKDVLFKGGPATFVQ